MRWRPIPCSAFAILASVNSCASTPPKRSAFAALMGAVNPLTREPVELPFSAGAVKPYATHGCIVGKIQNKTGAVLTGIAVSIVADPAYTGAPPRIVGGSVGSATLREGKSGERLTVNLDTGVRESESLSVILDLAEPDPSAASRDEAPVFIVKIEAAKTTARAVNYAK